MLLKYEVEDMDALLILEKLPVEEVAVVTELQLRFMAVKQTVACGSSCLPSQK